MFTFTGNNTDHSGGAAVEDEIVRDTGRAMGQILAAARAFIHSRGRKGSKGVPKLSRQERKDLAEAIRVQVGEQKIAAAWFTKRVNDYHAEVVAAEARRWDPAVSPEEVANADARLAGIRYSIESSLHETTALPLERRGQVAIALSVAQSNPGQPYGAIFKQMDPAQERTARAAAVASEQWVAGRRERNERLVAEQRAQAAKLAEARRELRPPRGYDELDQRQRNAVQRLRSAHLGVDRAGRALEPGAGRTAREAAERAALSAGLTRREIGHEIDYMAEHTSYTGTYGVPGGGQVRNHYPFREDALSETTREMSWDSRLPRDATVFAAVEARPDGLAADDVERRSVMAPRHEAVNTVARWSREPEFEHVIARPHEVAVARIEPGTGKVLASESATVGSEAAAMDLAHRSVTSTASDTARMRVEITDPQQPEHPRYESYGLPQTLSTDLADQRVMSREVLLGEAEIDRIELGAQLGGLRHRHGLSIEHNADLTERNARLTKQLTAMIAERDQAVAESGQLRQERDEAVQKLVERTSPEQRLGSPERQATESRVRQSAPANAFRNTKSVNAFAAVAAERERDGMER